MRVINNHRAVHFTTALFAALAPLLVAAADADVAAQSERLDFPSFGISVPVPHGFARDTDDQTSVAVFVQKTRGPDAARGDKPPRFIWIDVRPKAGKSVADLAAESARAEGLVPGRTGAKWGGEPAIEHVAPKGAAAPSVGRPAGSVRAVRQLVREHEGCVYRVRLAANAFYADDPKPLDTLASGTRWSPIAHAGRGVAARMPRLALENGMIVRLPDPFRPDMRAPGKFTMTMLAIDLPTKRVAAKLVVIPLPADDGPWEVASVKQDVERNIVDGLRLTEPFRWDADDKVAPANAEDGGAGRPPLASFAMTPRLKTEDGWAQVLVACVADNPASAFSLQCFGDAKTLEGMQDALPLLRDSVNEAARATAHLAKERRAAEGAKR